MRATQLFQPGSVLRGAAAGMSKFDIGCQIRISIICTQQFPKCSLRVANDASRSCCSTIRVASCASTIQMRFFANNLFLPACREQLQSCLVRENVAPCLAEVRQSRWAGGTPNKNAFVGRVLFPRRCFFRRGVFWHYCCTCKWNRNFQAMNRQRAQLLLAQVFIA